MKIKGIYWVLPKKKDPDIMIYSTDRGQDEVKEYIDKVKFYLPKMGKLYNGSPAEAYPRRPLYAFNSPCGLCEYTLLCLDGITDSFTIEYDATAQKYEKILISPTEVIKYETCPRQWAYYKVGIRTPRKNATTECGTCIHTAIYQHILMGEDPIDVFDEEWRKTIENPFLAYGKYDNSQTLADIARANLKKFMGKWSEWKDEVLVKSIEKAYTAGFDSFILKVKPDMVAKKEEETIVVDWKFTSVNYSQQWVDISEQITAAVAVLLNSNDVEVTAEISSTTAST